MKFAILNTCFIKLKKYLYFCLLTIFVLFYFNSCGVLLFKKGNIKENLHNLYLSLLGNNSGSSSNVQINSGATNDKLPPSIVKSLPASNQIDIPITQTVQIQFSEDIDLTTVTPSNFKVLDGVTELIGTINGNNTSITFTFDSPLQYAHTYTVFLSGNIQDKAGNKIGSEYNYTFQTLNEPDTIPPSIVSIDPPNGTINVSETQIISILFNESIDPLSIDANSIRLMDGENYIRSIYNVLGNLVTIRPENTYPSLKKIDIVLNPGIKDLSGNTLTNSNYFQIYTGDTQSPYIVYSLPLNGDRSFRGGSLKAKIAFNELMNPSTINDTNIIILKENQQTPILINQESDGKTFSITPNSGWFYKTNYEILIKKNVKDVSGNSMIQDVSIKFFSNNSPNDFVIGNAHFCFTLNSGKVKCWGDNSAGQIGMGRELNVSNPDSTVNLNFGSPVEKLTTGGDHNCVLLADGSVKCWGYNYYGQLGYGNNDNIRSIDRLIALPLSESAIDLSAGSMHTCVVLVSGKVQCWGNNYYGQLGDGTGINKNDAYSARKSSLNGDKALQVFAGLYHTCVLLIDKTVKCWGSNFFGQLGVGNHNSNYDANNATRVNSLIDVTFIAVGNDFTCGYISSGETKCWGNPDKVGYAVPYYIYVNYSGTAEPTQPVDVLSEESRRVCPNHSIDSFGYYQCINSNGKIFYVPNASFDSSLGMRASGFVDFVNPNNSYICDSLFNCWGNINFHSTFSTSYSLNYNYAYFSTFSNPNRMLYYNYTFPDYFLLNGSFYVIVRRAISNTNACAAYINQSIDNQFRVKCYSFGDGNINEWDIYE